MVIDPLAMQVSYVDWKASVIIAVQMKLWRRLNSLSCAAIQKDTSCPSSAKHVGHNTQHNQESRHVTDGYKRTLGDEARQCRMRLFPVTECGTLAGSNMRKRTILNAREALAVADSIYLKRKCACSVEPRVLCFLYFRSLATVEQLVLCKMVHACAY